MSGERAAGAGAFGRWLARQRELRGLDREEVARLTKLAPPLVEALESGEPDRMPPRAYLVGVLRSYAAAVGLDADEVVLRWQEIEGKAPAPARAPASRRRRRVLVAVAAVAAGVAVAGALAWRDARRQSAPAAAGGAAQPRPGAGP